MDSEIIFSQPILPVFTGESYDLWEVRMKTYLEALDLWEAVEEDYDILLLSDDPTMNQIRIHKEKKTKKEKAKSCLFAGVSQTIFTRIMALDTNF